MPAGLRRRHLAIPSLPTIPENIMAEPPNANNNQQPQNANTANRLPLFHGNTQDSLTAKAWLEFVNRTSLSQGWSQETTFNNAINALRDRAATWFSVSTTEENLITYDSFKSAFLDCFQKQGDSRGFAHIVRMIQPRQHNEHILDFYNRLMVEYSSWQDTLPAMNIPTQKDQLHPRAIRDLPGYELIPLSVLQETMVRGFEMGQASCGKHVVNGFFYAGLNADLRTYLQGLDIEDITGMRKAAIRFEHARHGLKPAGAVQAVRQTSKRASTGPPSADKKKQFTCYYCNKKGHTQQECRKRIRENGELKPPPKRVNEVSSDAQPEDPPKDMVNAFQLNF